METLLPEYWLKSSSSRSKIPDEISSSLLLFHSVEKDVDDKRVCSPVALTPHSTRIKVVVYTRLQLKRSNVLVEIDSKIKKIDVLLYRLYLFHLLEKLRLKILTYWKDFLVQFTLS